jgi:hypothetical protein
MRAAGGSLLGLLVLSQTEVSSAGFVAPSNNAPQSASSFREIASAQLATREREQTRFGSAPTTGSNPGPMVPPWQAMNPTPSTNNGNTYARPRHAPESPRRRTPDTAKANGKAQGPASYSVPVNGIGLVKMALPNNAATAVNGPRTKTHGFDFGSSQPSSFSGSNGYNNPSPLGQAKIPNYHSAGSANRAFQGEKDNGAAEQNLARLGFPPPTNNNRANASASKSTLPTTQTISSTQRANRNSQATPSFYEDYLQKQQKAGNSASNGMTLEQRTKAASPTAWNGKVQRQQQQQPLAPARVSATSVGPSTTSAPSARMASPQPQSSSSRGLHLPAEPAKKPLEPLKVNARSVLPQKSQSGTVNGAVQKNQQMPMSSRNSRTLAASAPQKPVTASTTNSGATTMRSTQPVSSSRKPKLSVTLRDLPPRKSVDALEVVRVNARAQLPNRAGTPKKSIDVLDVARANAQARFPNQIGSHKSTGSMKPVGTNSARTSPEAPSNYRYDRNPLPANAKQSQATFGNLEPLRTGANVQLPSTATQPVTARAAKQQQQPTTPAAAVLSRDSSPAAAASRSADGNVPPSKPFKDKALDAVKAAALGISLPLTLFTPQVQQNAPQMLMAMDTNAPVPLTQNVEGQEATPFLAPPEAPRVEKVQASLPQEKAQPGADKLLARATEELKMAQLDPIPAQPPALLSPAMTQLIAQAGDLYTPQVDISFASPYARYYADEDFLVLARATAEAAKARQEAIVDKAIAPIKGASVDIPRTELSQFLVGMKSSVPSIPILHELSDMVKTNQDATIGVPRSTYETLMAQMGTAQANLKAGIKGMAKSTQDAVVSISQRKYEALVAQIEAVGKDIKTFVGEKILVEPPEIKYSNSMTAYVERMSQPWTPVDQVKTPAYSMELKKPVAPPSIDVAYVGSPKDVAAPVELSSFTDAAKTSDTNPVDTENMQSQAIMASAATAADGTASMEQAPLTPASAKTAEDVALPTYADNMWQRMVSSDLSQAQQQFGSINIAAADDSIREVESSFASLQDEGVTKRVVSEMWQNAINDNSLF